MRHATVFRRPPYCSAIVASLFLSGPVRAQFPPAVDMTEKEAYARVADLWLDFAKVAVDKGARDPAGAALKTAVRYGLPLGEASKVEPLVEKAMSGEGPPEVKAKELEVREKTGLVFDHLAKRLVDVDAPRAEEFMYEAIRITPNDKKRCTALQVRATMLAGKKDKKATQRLLFRIPEVDPEGVKAGKYVPAESWLGKDDLILVRAKEHQMVAYVSLPKEWSVTAKTAWPVVIAIAGADCGYEARARAIKNAAANRPYVVICPVTLANAPELTATTFPLYSAQLIDRLRPIEKQRTDRMNWDYGGVSAMLLTLHERFRIDQRVFLAGASTGGYFTYWFILKHPEDLHAACAASANFDSEWRPVGAASVPDGGPPVLLVSGDADSAKERIAAQMDQAAELLKAGGFTGVTRQRVKGKPHEAFPGLTLDFFDANRAKSGKK